MWKCYDLELKYCKYYYGKFTNFKWKHCRKIPQILAEKCYSRHLPHGNIVDVFCWKDANTKWKECGNIVWEGFWIRTDTLRIGDNVNIDEGFPICCWNSDGKIAGNVRKYVIAYETFFHVVLLLATFEYLTGRTELCMHSCPLELCKVTVSRNVNQEHCRPPRTPVSKWTKHGYVAPFVSGPDPLVDLTVFKDVLKNLGPVHHQYHHHVEFQ